VRTIFFLLSSLFLLQLFPEEDERIAEEAIKGFETVAHTARYVFVRHNSLQDCVHIFRLH